MQYRQLLANRTEAFVPPALRKITHEVQKVHGVNLGQGVCQLPTPPLIVEEAHRAALEGINRYTHPRGLLSLRKAIASKLERHNGLVGLDPEREVLITCGATGAFEAVCAVLLNPGDEVIVFEPYYPYHLQALKRYQAQIRFVPLTGDDWSFDPEAVRAALSPRTKFILVNTPGNPTGKIFSREELETLAAILEGSSTLVVTDEIYEYMTFDGARHLSPSTVPALQGRVITMGGYSKTFSITGWRIGYLVAPADLTESLAAFLDAVYVCAPAPLQEAVARGIESFDDAFYSELCAKYQRKRDHFADQLEKLGLHPQRPKGAYYMICRYEGVYPGVPSMPFVEWMIASAGVGAVPSDDFVRDPSKALWIRFCLAVEDNVLEDALVRLARLATA